MNSGQFDLKRYLHVQTRLISFFGLKLARERGIVLTQDEVALLWVERGYAAEFHKRYMLKRTKHDRSDS